VGAVEQQGITCGDAAVGAQHVDQCRLELRIRFLLRIMGRAGPQQILCEAREGALGDQVAHRAIAQDAVLPALDQYPGPAGTVVGQETPGGPRERADQLARAGAGAQLIREPVEKGRLDPGPMRSPGKFDPGGFEIAVLRRVPDCVEIEHFAHAGDSIRIAAFRRQRFALRARGGE